MDEYRHMITGKTAALVGAMLYAPRADAVLCIFSQKLDNQFSAN